MKTYQIFNYSETWRHAGITIVVSAVTGLPIEVKPDHSFDAVLRRLSDRGVSVTHGDSVLFGARHGEPGLKEFDSEYGWIDPPAVGSGEFSTWLNESGKHKLYVDEFHGRTY